MFWVKAKPDQVSSEVLYLRSQVSDLQAQIQDLLKASAELQQIHAKALSELAQQFIDTLRPKASSSAPKSSPQVESDERFPGSRPNLRPTGQTDDDLANWMFRSEPTEGSKSAGLDTDKRDTN